MTVHDKSGFPHRVLVHATSTHEASRDLWDFQAFQENVPEYLDEVAEWRLRNVPDDREILSEEPTRESLPIAFPEANGWAEGPEAEGMPFQLGEQPDGTRQAISCWKLTDEAIAEIVRTRCVYVGVRGERPVAMWIRAIRGNVFCQPAPTDPDAPCTECDGTGRIEVANDPLCVEPHEIDCPTCAPWRDTDE